MLAIRRGEERGRTSQDWLDSRHSFSFGDYSDPAQTGFSVLRVINEDRVAPAAGFAEHGHRDMEIISYVLAGGLKHRDSLGHGSQIRPGDVQRLSAGRGVRHSEFNASDREPVHFLQIWILPKTNGIAPGYEQKHYPPETLNGTLRLIASADGRDGSVTLHQDADLYAVRLDGSTALTHALAPGRCAYLHVARGAIAVNGHPLAAGDGVRIRDESAVELNHGHGAEALLFDLP